MRPLAKRGACPYGITNHLLISRIWHQASTRFWVTLVLVAVIVIVIALVVSVLTSPSGVFSDYIPSI
jgi:uncharacterized membrane protein